MGASSGGGGSERAARQAQMQRDQARKSGLGSNLSVNSKVSSGSSSKLGGGASGKGVGSNLSATGRPTSDTHVGGKSGNSRQGFGQGLAVTAPSVSAGAPKFAGEQLAPLPTPSVPPGGGNDFSAAPTLRLTPQGLLLVPNNDPQTSEGNRLGSNDGGGGNEGIAQPRQAAAPATPPAQPSPPQQPRQRAASLQRGPAVEEPRTLLTLGLADVTRKSLLGV